MYQYDQNQMGPAARAAQPKQPSAPQKTKFTVDDLKEIMNVLMPAIDYPGAATRAVIPPGNFTETVGYGKPEMAMNLRRIPVPEQPRVRVIPGQPTVVPPGYYE